MKKDPDVFLDQILVSVDLIEKYSENLAFAKFQKNGRVQDAIIRRLEIIGEAVKNLPTSHKSKCPDISWKEMADMGDMLIRQYFEIDLSLAWKVVKHELPAIKKKILAILSK